jgi:hypothetical protein
MNSLRSAWTGAAWPYQPNIRAKPVFTNSKKIMLDGRGLLMEV